MHVGHDDVYVKIHYFGRGHALFEVEYEVIPKLLAPPCLVCSSTANDHIASNPTNYSIEQGPLFDRSHQGMATGRGEGHFLLPR